MRAVLVSFILIFPATYSVFPQAGPDDTIRSFINTLGMEFELIHPGTMTVGRMQLECPTPPDTRDVIEAAKWTEEDFELCETLATRDSRPGFAVTIEKQFYIGKYEVTQEHWKKVMGANPSFYQGGKIDDDANQHPVENVSWEQAQAFVKKLNELDTSYVYRLPTEFEWEYAARAGAGELLSWKETREQAWILATNKGTTKAVGQLEPNRWGLYDMLGNVWEWVEDYHNGDIFPGPVPPSTGEVHVLRGGSFISDVANATYFYHGGGPGNGYDVGFRIVREAK